MTRKKAREEAFKIIFQNEFLQEQPQDVWNKYFQESAHSVAQPLPNDEPVVDIYAEDKNCEYMRKAIEGVFEHLEEIDSLIKQNIFKIDFSRLAKVNLAIMRLAIYEMKYMDDIPISVSINEAVEMSKTYDCPESSAFVNGTLGSIQKIISPDL